MKMSDNTILITGGTAGIGLEFATQLLKLGNTVIVTGRDQEKLEDTKRKLPNIHVFQSDATDLAAIGRLYEDVTREFPDLNMLINNAGIMRIANLNTNEVVMEDLTNEIETNLIAPIRMVKQFIPHLLTKKTSAIVNVTSGLAFMPLPTTPIYCAAKAGLHSFTLSLRLQLRYTNIKVFELAPPAINTSLVKGVLTMNTNSSLLMESDILVKKALKGFENNQLEIRPGLSTLLKWISRIAPIHGPKVFRKDINEMIKKM
jgi:uncharacterized oxidoreductase